jgi:DNA-binding LacI/PurR family transcriptional regulator
MCNTHDVQTPPKGPTKQKRAERGGQVSLATLSAHLGLSQAAISRVLNRAPAAQAIPLVTQERIFAAAREFKYRPNVLARSLRRGHSMTIGVLVPEISEGYATLVLAGLEQGLLKAGYAFFLCSHHHDKEVIERSQTMLVERAVDGIVAIDTPLIHFSMVPTVTVSCPNPTGETTDIILDHPLGADLAMEHLHGLGHRNVAVIKGQRFSSDTEPRWLAIKHAAERLGILLNPANVTQLEGDAPTHEPGYLATKRLLASEYPFTAIFSFNDVSAIGAVRALREAGLQVPRDVSVVGFDDVQSAAFQNPSLTTVRQPLRSMGLLAAEQIVKAIEDGVSMGAPVVVAPELVVRESTSRAPRQAFSLAPDRATRSHASQ